MTARPSHYLGDLTREELRERLPSATVVIPVGSTEQHGRHLPMMTDTLMANTVATRAAALASDRADVIVSHPLPFGCSHHHLTVGGALSITQRAYIAVLSDLGDCLARMGCRRLIFLNGHGGNEDPIRVVASELVMEKGHDMAVAAASYWTIAAEPIAAIIRDAPGHAGTFETACVLAVRPDLVHMDRRFEEDTRPRALAKLSRVGDVPIRRAGVWQASQGVSDAARDATVELGQRLVDAIIPAVADFFVAFTNQPPMDRDG